MFVQGQLRRAAAWILVAAVAAASAGCSDDSGIGVTPVQTTRDVFFSSTIQSGGFAWRSFKVERAGKVTVQYVSDRPDGRPRDARERGHLRRYQLHADDHYR